MAEAKMTSARPSRRGHGPGAMMTTEKAKDFKGTFIILNYWTKSDGRCNPKNL